MSDGDKSMFFSEDITNVYLPFLNQVINPMGLSAH